jgi:hypothetical protein
MNVNHLYILFEENRKHDKKFEPSDPYVFVKTPPPLYFLFYFFEIPEIFLQDPRLGIR